MNAIRPLLTLTVLLILGVLLWHRISNPGLAPPPEDLEAMELADAALNGPDLPGDKPASDTAANSAPAPAATANQASPAGATATITPVDPSGLESLPPLPAIPGGNPSSAPLPLPDDIPTANYGETTPPVTPPAAVELPSDGGITPVEANVLAGETGTATAPAPRYGSSQEFGAGPSPFAAARGDIDRALASGDLRNAHQLLTGWYGDRTLSQEEQNEVASLLSQLAGTVVYSTEYPLEPPHTVVAGETLESIAQQYQVPWQLLAKINGIATPNAVTPGQSIKVLRGPFSAVIDVDRQEMALMVANLYAGRFSVKTEGMAANEGEWTVAEKIAPTGTEVAPKHVVLTSEIAPGSFSSIVLGTSSVDSPAAQAGAIRVAPTDQEDLFDILSIGSKVLIRK
jgi:LysM repeat protein